MPDEFKEYKRQIIANMDEFKNCREAHQSEFKQIHLSLYEMRKDIISEITKIDKRLLTVEVKSGLWGLLSGLVPFAIYFFTNHK